MTGRIQEAFAGAEIVRPDFGGDDCRDRPFAPSDAEPVDGAAVLREDEGEPELLPLADLAEWAKMSAAPTPFLMPGRIPEREVTLFTGHGGANKSTFGHQLVVCFAADQLMLGVRLLEHGNALYVTAEDNFSRLHWMQQHICDAVGVSQDSLVEKLHISSVRGDVENALAIFDQSGRIRATNAFHRLRATLLATRSKLLVLDNVGHMFAGNENDRVQVTAFVNLLYSLCNLGVTIVLIAHPNKSGDSYSGSTAWVSAVRSHLILERPEDSDDPDERRLTVGKSNYARPDEALAFRWHAFALVRDEDLPADAVTAIRDIAKANGENSAFLKCLAAATAQKRSVSHMPGTNYAPKVFHGMTEGKGFSLKTLAAAMERLLHIGAIELDADLWKGRNRHPKKGIKLVEKCANPPAPTPCADLRQPPTETRGNACATLRAPPPPYTTYRGGRASPRHRAHRRANRSNPRASGSPASDREHRPREGKPQS